MNDESSLHPLPSSEVLGRSLRILMVLHMPWLRELGAPRCHIELAEEMRRLGHTVDKFDLNDALPRQSRFLSAFQMLLFSRRATQFVRANGAAYDVIMASQGNLTLSKRALGFPGILVVRSDGLTHFYSRWQRTVKAKGRLLGRAARWLAGRFRQEEDATEASFRHADLVTLLNPDEVDFAASRLGIGSKVLLLPNGLSEQRFGEFAMSRSCAEERLSSQKVAFIGYWSERKGAADFAQIVRLIRCTCVRAHFVLLGTGVGAEAVRRTLDAADRDYVEVIPHYRSEDLPSLLSTCTAGILPSYVEGFGLGVLESLAAGIPTASYDTPGPRMMLGQFARPMTAPCGNKVALAELVCDILRLPHEEYTLLSQMAADIASQFRWKSIAAVFLHRCIQMMALTK